MPELTLNTAEPLAFDYYAAHNLVSTLASLADPLNEAGAAAYRAAGKMFTFVGTLLDVAGSQRSAGHLGFSNPADAAAATLQTAQQQEASAAAAGERHMMKAVEAAVALGDRSIVYVSMGTVLTGGHPDYGWTATAGSSLTGKQLCQAVYKAVFASVGSDRERAPTTTAARAGARRHHHRPSSSRWGRWRTRWRASRSQATQSARSECRRSTSSVWERYRPSWATGARTA